MAEKTGSNNSWQPMLGARDARLSLLGRLLRLRRAEIGYRHVPAFTEARDINARMVGDIEHGRRDTFTFPTLEDVAAAYEVTYMSMMAVIWSDAGELVPADAAGPAAVIDPLDLPPAPFDDPVREAADRPYAETIWRRFLDLPRRVTEPSGAEMFPGAPDDARAWDGIGARLPLGDLVWVIADLRRREAGRSPNSGTGAAAS